MEATDSKDPQENPSINWLDHFNDKFQSFQNAFDQKNKATRKGIQYIQSDIERLLLEKSEPDAPVSIIQKRIEVNKGDIPMMQAKLVQRENVRDQLMKQIDSLIDQATLDLDKEVEEISSESTNQKPQPVDFLTHLIESFAELPEI